MTLYKQMKLFLILLAFHFLIINQSLAQSYQDSLRYSQQIIRMEQEMMDAIPTGDTNVWKKYLDKQFFVVTEDGTRYTRQPFLATFHPLPNGYSGWIKVTQLKFGFHSNTAVIAYISDEHEFIFGQELHTTYSSLNTYYKTDTSWMMMSSEVFEIPQLPPPIPMAKNTLQQFTGTYQLTDTVTCRITLKGDTLFIQKKGSSKQALFAETPTVFFRMADTRGRKIFTTENKSNLLMRERRNGEDVVWKRISNIH